MKDILNRKLANSSPPSKARKGSSWRLLINIFFYSITITVCYSFFYIRITCPFLDQKFYHWKIS